MGPGAERGSSWPLLASTFASFTRGTSGGDSTHRVFVLKLLLLGLSTAQFYAIVIGVPVGAVILIIAITLVSVPSLRKKVFPYRRRIKFDQELY